MDTNDYDLNFQMHILFKLSTTEVSVWKCGVSEPSGKNTPELFSHHFCPRPLLLWLLKNLHDLRLYIESLFLGFTVMACNEASHTI